MIPFTADAVDRPAYAALREACRRFRFLPTFRHGILLDGAMAAPEDEAAVAGMRQATHQEVRRFRVSPADFERALADVEEAAAAEPAAREDAGVDRPLAPRPEAWDFSRHSAREIAHLLVAFAFSAGASDFFLDEQEGWMDVAIKVGGTKEMLPPVERGFGPLLLKAFKEMAGLSTHTVASGQSGFARVAVAGGRRADLRVEVTPTLHGESLVARVQDRELQLQRMRRLPFSDPDQTRVARLCLRQPQGLIVVTGPTGHGKTTTLYSCLGQLDRSALNIRTLEDPVEFAVPWITQIPVGAGTGRTFGDGLRSLLRQAPHVILMGEIRDRAVAQTCIEAADTGHLILATLHTRDAIGVVSRLLDLGLTGGQLAGALTLAIGQRLLRRLCPHCRRPAPPDPGQKRHFHRHGLPVPETLWVPAGCARCGQRGEHGLVPAFEFFHPGGHDSLAEAMARASRESYRESELRRLWLAQGGAPLARDGLRLAGEGTVTHAEALKYERAPDETC